MKSTPLTNHYRPFAVCCGRSPAQALGLESREGTDEVHVDIATTDEAASVTRCRAVTASALLPGKRSISTILHCMVHI